MAPTPWAGKLWLRQSLALAAVTFGLTACGGIGGGANDPPVIANDPGVLGQGGIQQIIGNGQNGGGFQGPNIGPGGGGVNPDGGPAGGPPGGQPPLNPAPEPGTSMLLISGLTATVAYYRARRSPTGRGRR